MTSQNGDLETQTIYSVRSIKNKIDAIPAVVALGLSEATLKSNGDVEFILPVTEIHTNTYGVIHGGLFVTLLDTAMGGACHYLNNIPVVTLNIAASFIGNCRPGSIISIVGRVVHSGRRTMVAEGIICDETGKLLCKSQGTFFVKEKS